MVYWHKLKQEQSQYHNDLTPNNFYKICTDLSLKHFQYNLDDPADKTNIWIGYSGGADSRVLLELASRAFVDNNRYNLTAVYINHHLSCNADAWQQHCMQTCKQLKINLQVADVIVDPAKLRNLGSLECLLRKERMDIWHRLLGYNDILLLAHHLNDQIETVFLRLFRGTGLRGLSGIKIANYLGTIKVMRPLLNYTKTQILEFANSKQLQYIEDESNNDQAIARNFLRHKVLPLLFERWPSGIYNINNTISLLTQTDQFIAVLAKKLLRNCYSYCSYFYIDNRYHDLRTLSISKLFKQEYFLQVAVLREFISSNGFDLPTINQVNLIYTEVINARIDRNPKLKIGNYFICRYRDNLYLYSNTINCSNNSMGNNRHVLGDLLIIKGDQTLFSWGSKAKKIFQKFAVPPWLRSNYSLVYLNKELIAIIGLWHKEL